MFKLMPLPYAYDALEPVISRETLEYHHDKHHRAYVDKLNKLVKEEGLEGKSLEDLICSASGEVFNNAGQVWNHNFYWLSLCADGEAEPAGPLKRAVELDFGSVADFKTEFDDVATKLFGSGWTWLVRDGNGKLAIEQTHDADNPLRRGSTPLWVVDVWEHAYYVDYRNARNEYLEAIWGVIDWKRVGERYQAVSSTKTPVRDSASHARS